MTKTFTIAATACLLAGVGPRAIAHADSAQATCEVRDDGHVKKDASGPCTFSQRQGYVDVTLKNGFTHSFSPTDKPQHYKDANGHKVVRVVHDDSHTYKWDEGDKKIIVTFGAAGAGAKDAAPAKSASERAGQGDFDARGNIPCSQGKGQPMGQCPFAVAREGGGTATVIVTRPDGRTRAIFFNKGKAVSADLSQADGDMSFSAKKEADLYQIQAGHERYEIPEAVVFGG